MMVVNLKFKIYIKLEKKSNLTSVMIGFSLRLKINSIHLLSLVIFVGRLSDFRSKTKFGAIR